jgi:2-polyprenyl-3-methyl-5-hydroxy-6-metoxy-1,4-benzoquinol methylase
VIPDLATRAPGPELMDADDLAPDTYAEVLAGLAGVNRLTLARRPTLVFLKAATAGMERFSLLDVGFGQGDMLRDIARWAAKRGLAAELTGIDLNPKSAPVAEAATDPALGIRYRTGDAFALTERPDFIVSSLVAHHMTDGELVDFLAWMERTAVRGWFVNDLHRHWIAWGGFKLGSAVLGFHPIVRHDGALSVRRSFRPAEWRALLGAAGVQQAEIRWWFPFRLCVSRRR